MTIAIGDIHGCLVPLRRLIAQLPQSEELVFLGDYIDRGPDIAGVIHFLIELAAERPCHFLMGNHEQLMEQAIRSAEEDHVWFSNGGEATLASYGADPSTWVHSANRSAFLGEHRSFFGGLRYYHETDDTIFVHAGIDPDIPRMADQSPEVLLWIRERFFRNAAQWQGKQIVFGHTPTFNLGLPRTAIFRSGRIIGIDTGCVYGGCLTAIDSGTHRIFQEANARGRYP